MKFNLENALKVSIYGAVNGYGIGQILGRSYVSGGYHLNKNSPIEKEMKNSIGNGLGLMLGTILGIVGFFIGGIEFLQTESSEIQNYIQQFEPYIIKYAFVLTGFYNNHLPSKQISTQLEKIIN